MHVDAPVNILLVDDQPAKLLSYETVLRELGENILTAASGQQALEQLLKHEVAIVLMDVCMPELDGFQLAAMIREHPRFQNTAIIFVSAVLLTDIDRLRGYEMGAVDYVPVPVVPEVLRAKVKVFAELYRKSRQLEQLNAELERRVAQRTAELEASTAQLRESEERRTLALAAGQMGSWDWDVPNESCVLDEGQHRIFGVDPANFVVTPDSIRKLIHSEDWDRVRTSIRRMAKGKPYQTEFRIRRPTGEIRWCLGTAAATVDGKNRIVRVSGVTIDITERKAAEERQVLLAREVDHRARNALAVMQSIVRLTRANSLKEYIAAVEGRIRALSRAHTLLAESRWDGAELARLVDEELAPYRTGDRDRVSTTGARVSLDPSMAQTLALALHELATNAVKYGALSVPAGKVELRWELQHDRLELQWSEGGGPPVHAPVSRGFGTTVIKASLEQQLGGTTRFLWQPEGLHFTLSIPRRDAIQYSELGRNGRSGDAHDIVMGPRLVLGHRILLVEDEPLIAMMMHDMLGELGYSVVGPCNTVDKAIAAAKQGNIDGAILDINLGLDPVYPVAEILTKNGVPFVFVTGYGAESVDGRFAKVPVFQKPLEPDVLTSIFTAVRDAI